jgi:hypothetical protein
MALPTTNDFSGRQWRIVVPGSIPYANAKIDGGIWTGGTAGDVFTITDEAGREYDWVFPADGSAVTITKLGWLSGPITITSIPHGEVQLYIGGGK